MRYRLKNLPIGLRHGSSEMPLGRYLSRMLRVMSGHEAQGDTAKNEAQLQMVRQIAWFSGRSVKDVYREVNAGFAANLRARLVLQGEERL
jgi:hypothetical protein